MIRTRETSAKVTTETAYYLLSTPLSAERFGHVARSHWAVENSLHWCLDVIMNEDNARNRLDNGPYNLAILRHMALNLIRKEPSKGSLRVKIKRAGWKDAFLAKVLPASTAVYLTITADLLQAAGERFERFAAPLSTGGAP